MKIAKYSRPFQNKMPTSLDKPLEAEPRVKANIPKPEYESALEGLAMLDKQSKSNTVVFMASVFLNHTAMP